MRRSKIWRPALVGIFLLAGLWLMVSALQTRAQSSEAAKKLSGPETKNPGAWPYADAYDEVTAAGEAYRVRYEDDHIRLVEVGVVPGAHTKMHGDPYAAVIAMDSPSPKIENVVLDPDSQLNGQGSGHAPPPQGLQYPLGQTDAPLAPHAVTNNDTFPLHYFKIEFKRIDGDDYATHWKNWYPWMLNPLMPILNVDPKDPRLGQPVSKEYPFSPTLSFSKCASGRRKERMCTVTPTHRCLRAISALPRRADRRPLRRLLPSRSRRICLE
jgi:hypothetical protein